MWANANGQMPARIAVDHSGAKSERDQPVRAPPIWVKNKAMSGAGDGSAGMDRGPGIWHFTAYKNCKMFCISKKSGGHRRGPY